MSKLGYYKKRTKAILEKIRNFIGNDWLSGLTTFSSSYVNRNDPQIPQYQLQDTLSHKKNAQMLRGCNHAMH